MAMKIKYDAEADAVYMRLSEAEISETQETDTGVIIDLDAEGKIVGMEFLNAREFFSPSAISSFEKAA